MPIFDQGYQHWKGRLSGHAWRWVTISRQGFRVQFKGRYVRLLLILAWMPALALVAALAVWGLFEQGALGGDLLKMLQSQGLTDDPQTFRQAFWTLSYKFFFQTELYFILLLVTITGPNLISLDLRYNSLPLYLSRPVTRLDYFLGKLGVIAALVAAVAVLPAAAAYVLGVCFSLDLTVVRDTWRLLPASLAYGTVIVLSAGTLMLALSSLSRRSLYVGLTWVGLFLIGWTIAGVLSGIHEEILMHDRFRKLQEMNQAQAQFQMERRQPWEGGRPPRPGGKDSVRMPDARNPGRMPMVRGRTDLAHGGVASHVEPGDWKHQQQKILEEIEQAESESRKKDWRPLFSYTANLQRIGEAILGTDAAWVQFGRAYEQRRSQLEVMAGGAAGPWSNSIYSEPINERRLAEFWVPQYPWIWSAAVLAGLGGLSLCILSTRVKSLDRLR
jgi:ABC-2 type transport system permease protein